MALALEERINPSLRNWDDFMFSLLTKTGSVKKYQIIHAIQDFYFVELVEREKNKKYALMHFTKNKKETNAELVKICFNLEEMLYFTDYRSRDWFLEMIKF